MRFHFDDNSERALLAARLGHSEGVGDADLAEAVAAWFDGRPTTGRGRRLTPADLENIRVVADADSLLDQAEAGGYAADSTWLGQG